MKPLIILCTTLILSQPIQAVDEYSPSLVVFAQQNSDELDTKWHANTIRDPFIKPIASYPILCDQFKNGFTFGFLVILGWTFWSSFNEEYHQKAPILPIILAPSSLLYSTKYKREYKNFYNSSEHISCKWRQEMPLSQRIFSLAVKCRATKSDRRHFHERYKTLRVKLDQDEPFGEEEKACDDLLIFWQKQSFFITPDTPKKTTRELHNELYNAAIKGIMHARFTEGFMTGTLCALPAAVLLSALS